jgi:hypothetical protein
MDLNIMCWIILASSVVVGFVAVAGMLSDKFKDTFLQCLSLSAVSLGGFIITLQIYVHGIVQISGIAFQSLAVAMYAVTSFVKYARKQHG